MGLKKENFTLTSDSSASWQYQSLVYYIFERGILHYLFGYFWGGKV